MTVHFHVLHTMGHLALAEQEPRALHLVLAKGRASLLEVPVGWWSVWMPLAHELRVQSAETEWILGRRDLLVWSDGGVRNSEQRQSWFLALSGTPGAWRPYLSASAHASGAATLLPARDTCPGDVRRFLVHLARILRRGDTPHSMLDRCTTSACNAVVASQHALQFHLTRCGGKTTKLLRLLRVRHVIDNSASTRLDLQHLSRIASYSPWHLTRAYRDVFGETPSEHAARVRLHRAMRLVSDTRLSVREITDALGFESQSTFCRSFKRAYGVTTTQARA